MKYLSIVITLLAVWFVYDMESINTIPYCCNIKPVVGANGTLNFTTSAGINKIWSSSVKWEVIQRDYGEIEPICQGQ